MWLRKGQAQVGSFAWVGL